MAGSLQRIYEKVFHQDHHGMRRRYRLLIWIAVLCLTVIFDTLAGRPGRDAFDGATIDMTLTSAACPLTDVIEEQATSALEGLVTDFPH